MRWAELHETQYELTLHGVLFEPTLTAGYQSRKVAARPLHIHRYSSNLPPRWPRSTPTS